MAPAERFQIVLGGVAALDRETGLVWERTPSSTIADFALTPVTCLQKTLGGRLGWRLPTTDELFSLQDPTQSNPPLPAGHPFTNISTTVPYYTTSTPSVGSHIRIFMSTAGTIVQYNLSDDSTTRGWCVRGGLGPTQ
jgi:hypothetical protein